MGEPADERTEALVAHGLGEAERLIVKWLSEQVESRPVVSITGPVASGKSTLAALVAAASNGLTLATDRYLPDYHSLPPQRRDDPLESDLQRLREDLMILKVTGSAEVPVWSFFEHRRTGQECVRSAGPIVCEGLFALHDSIIDAVSLGVFVEAPPAVRWSRWEAIETAGERGWGVERAREHFHQIAEPTFQRLAMKYRASADLIVFNDGSTST